MSILKKFTAGTLALVLATGVAGSVIAQSDEEGDVTVRITAMSGDQGILSASIGDLDFGAHQYSLQDQDVDGTIAITASDLRGTAAGWNVTITGGNFNDEFTIGNLGLTADDISTTSSTAHSTEAQPVASDIVAVSTGEQTVLTAIAGTGAGTYSADFDASLNIPGGTLVGEYNTTLTVTITGNSPGAPVEPGEGDNN